MYIGIFLFLFTIKCLSIEPYFEYFNTRNSDVTNHNSGIGIKLKTNIGKIRCGVEYLSLANYGTIHDPINHHIVTEQTLLGIPIGFENEWKLRNKIKIAIGFGYKFYSQQSISATQINTIESAIANNGQKRVQNYSETMAPNLYYRVEFSYNLWENMVVSFSKTWQTMQNKIKYTYLDNYSSEKTSEFNYDPISISMLYHF